MIAGFFILLLLIAAAASDNKTSRLEARVRNLEQQLDIKPPVTASSIASTVVLVFLGLIIGGLLLLAVSQ